MKLSEAGKLMAFVHTTRPEAARAFYEGVLGLTLLSDDPFALVFDSGGTTLRVAKVERLTPAPGTVLGWIVEDIAAAIDAFTAVGVVFEGTQQGGPAIHTFPGGDRVAWFKDPDGNPLSLTQFA